MIISMAVRENGPNKGQDKSFNRQINQEGNSKTGGGKEIYVFSNHRKATEKLGYSLHCCQLQNMRDWRRAVPER